MAEFTGIAQLNGFTYEIYDKLVNLVPKSAKLIRSVPYVGGEKELGNKFHQNLQVTDEAGFTHAAPGAGAFTVNPAISLSTVDAYVEGYQLVLQSSLDYEAAARASSSRKAYAAIAETKLKNMVESTRRRLECELWYGQSGLGTLNTFTNVNATETRLVITAAEHAPLIWGGKNGFEVVAYNGAAQVGGVFTIKTVNVDDAARTVTVTGAGADITALQNAITANPDVLKLFWRSTVSGALVFATMVGVDKIAPNAGSLFGVDAAVYDLWAGNSYAVGGVAFTFAKLINGLAALANRGLDEDVQVWVHNRTWANLASDQAALKRYAAEVETAKNGFKVIRFAHMTGDVEIVGSGMVKAGSAYGMATKHLKRIGAQDVSFKTPGRNPGDDIFWHDPTKAGFSYRLYTNQALFCDNPSRLLKYTGITNS